MGERGRADRIFDRAAAAGRSVAVLGLALVVIGVPWSVLRYRQEYGTWRPFVTFPVRFHACDGSTYLAGRDGPYDAQIIAESTVLIDHTPGGRIYSSTPCSTTECPRRCHPEVVVVRDGDRARIYSLSGGP